MKIHSKLNWSMSFPVAQKLKETFVIGLKIGSDILVLLGAKWLYGVHLLLFAYHVTKWYRTTRLHDRPVG